VNFPGCRVSCDVGKSEVSIMYLNTSLRTGAGVLILRLRGWRATPGLMKPEDISIGVWTVVEGCDEVFERGAV
jgi:hypothetical protein